MPRELETQGQGAAAAGAGCGGPHAHCRHAVTESRNLATVDIDCVSTLDMVRMMNAEDAHVAGAVAAEAEQIAAAIDRIAARMRNGGRLVYIGAGTSGRIGVLDAAECPETFSIAPDLVVALIAGGERAFASLASDAEDDKAAGARAVASLGLDEHDSLVGVAASGRTPYVLGGMAEALRLGALVVSLACNRPSPMADLAQVAIAPLVGPEALMGSTRLKAGTAQKMVLNMISTGVMIRLGKTYSNLMVHVQTIDDKLRARARRIVELACGLGASEAAAALEASGGEVPTAIVATLAGVAPDEARRRLAAAGGSVRAALAP